MPFQKVPRLQAEVHGMDDNRLRAWWSSRQGLDGRLRGSQAADVLRAVGWARSVGGVGPYLTLFTRAGIRRTAVDEAVRRLEIYELPSTRGCTYVVPASDYALALTLASQFSGTEKKTAEKLGVTGKEVEKLKAAVVASLADGPLDVEAIRTAVGDAARSLGEDGKKRGMTTTLPFALGRLQEEGEIRRVPINGRLDQQRYLYTRWQPNPRTASSLSADEAFTELARRFFRWTGPATLAEFRWFSALGAKVAASAIAPLELVPMEAGSDRLMFADDREALHAFKTPTEPQYVLVSVVDGIHLLRRNLPSLLAEEDIQRPVLAEKGPTAAGQLTDFPSHAIMDRGRLIGLWEFDPERNDIAWSTFIPRNAALIAEVERTAAYVRNELGDARSFSLDSPKSRAPRVAALRAG